MTNIDKMITDIRANIEARIREGYGYGSLEVVVTVFPINSESQEWLFDARDYEIEAQDDKLTCVRHTAILLGPNDDCPVCKTWTHRR